MKSFVNYIKSIILGIWNLLQGLRISMLNFIRPKVTEQYPENRNKGNIGFDRFRAKLTMPHNEKNEHKCIACGICEMNCPNGTIHISTKMETDPETGKSKKVLDKYIYDLGTCTFCNQCVSTCPQGAIKWSQDFEQAVFTRDRLYSQLNAEGSKCEERKKPAPKVIQPTANTDNAQDK